MTGMKKPEDLTLDEVREQMASLLNALKTD